MTAIAPVTVWCVWTAPPAAAASTHTITMTGTLTVSDAPGLASGRTTRSTPFSRLVRLSHDRPDQTLTASACVGGETRGEVSVQAHLRSDEMVVVNSSLRIFEGSDCLSTDLDGSTRLIEQGFKPRQSLTGFQMSVENGEVGSDDYARVNFDLKHDGDKGIGIGRPAEPSSVVATRDPADPTRVNLEWSDPATDETHFEIFNSTLRQAMGVTKDTTSFVWTGLPLGKQCFQVRAVNAVGASDFTPFNPRSECV
ncbi:fibronectin type III domain-containing protein [Streptomyces sp. NPDC059999]|uniref:fibronectin type III domain-containing protein n=1 Tax=Streptomyces sp. NPDC059999 TaxID=3347030 RepID=UPI00367DFFEF